MQILKTIGNYNVVMFEPRELYKYRKELTLCIANMSVYSIYKAGNWSDCILTALTYLDAISECHRLNKAE